MKYGLIKRAIRFLLPVLCSATCIIALDLSINGMYLIGIPDIKNLEKATISHPAVSGEIREVSDPEQIELAVKLSGFLKYSLFKKPASGESPLITITYFTFDGESIEVSANRTTVWWKGKAHVIRDDNTFVNLTEGIFFLNDLVDEQGA